MTSVRPCALPPASLLRRYAQPQSFADRYVAEVDGAVLLPAFVEAFYTTRLFRVERGILARFAARPSTDLEARQLAAGETSTFAAWRVEGRSADQLLLSDFTGRTRSWLMVAPVAGAAGPRTSLFFGSAVMARTDARTGRRSMGLAFHVLLGFHRLYSRLLLHSARSRVLARGRAGTS